MPNSSAKNNAASRADIATVMEHNGLSEAEEIRFLTDLQLLQTPGIGSGKINRLRVDFPLAPGVSQAVKALEEEKRMLSGNQLIRIIEERRGRQIELGEIDGVKAIQFDGKCLAIATAGAPKLRVVGIRWASAEGACKHLDGCFGPEIDPLKIAAAPAFPTFINVTAVDIIPGYTNAARKVVIASETGIFTFNLFLRP